MGCWAIASSSVKENERKWKRITDTLFVSAEEDGDCLLPADCTLLYCNVDSFTLVRIPKSDSFYDALKHYTWFNAHNPISEKPVVEAIKVPQALLDLLQVAYLIPISQHEHTEQTTTTLDCGLLSFKLELESARFQPRNNIATLLLIAAVLYTYMLVSYELPTLQEMTRFVLTSHAPLGIKLNPQVDLLFGNFVLLFLDLWNSMVMPFLVQLWLCFAVCVVWRQFQWNLFWLLTLFVALWFDTITLLNLHVIVLHRLISKVCRFQLMLLRTCMLMMRGKKVNVLKKRVDAIQADSALLMLGTVAAFFLLFTLQTTLTYHVILLTCACGWFAVKSMLLFIVRLQFGNDNELEAFTRIVIVDGKWWLVAVRHEHSHLRESFSSWWHAIMCVPVCAWSKLSQGHELSSVPTLV